MVGGAVDAGAPARGGRDAPSTSIMAAAGALRGAVGPMSHCRRGPADDDCSPRQQPRRRTDMSRFVHSRSRRRGCSRDRGCRGPRSARQGRRRAGQGNLHHGSHLEAEAQRRERWHRGRVRGRPEPQRRSLAGDTAPQRLARSPRQRRRPGHRADRSPYAGSSPTPRGRPDRIVAVATSRSGATCRAAGSF